MDSDPRIPDPGPQREASANGPASSSGPAPGRRERRRRAQRAAPDCGPTLSQSAAGAWKQLLALGDYFQSLIGVQADRAATEVRRRATHLAIAAVVAVPLATILIASALRVVNGLAGGFARLFAGRAWLGDLLAGLVLLGALAGAGALLVARRERKELQKLQEKYEHQHREHRQRFEPPAADEPAAAPRS